MARTRNWSALSESTKKRYLGAGNAKGLSPAQTEEHYSSGKSLADFRGHNRPEGVSERGWATLVKAAKDAGLADNLPAKELPRGGPNPRYRGSLNDILKGEIEKGFTPVQLKRRIARQEAVRREWRDGNKEPGERAWRRRNLYMSDVFYWYH